MIKKKVVVKYKDGNIIKGWVEEFKPQRESFILYPLVEYSNQNKLLINFDMLKAVFFVKDFTGDKNYHKVRTFSMDFNTTPAQRKLIVDFKDEERLYGTCLAYRRFKKGFFVFPVDPKDNSERIFIIHSATKKIRLMKIEI